MKKSILIVAVMALALFRLFSQEKLSAAKTFLEMKESSGIEAALSWLDSLDAEKAKLYLCDEKDFLSIGKELRSYGYVNEAASFFQKATELIPQSSAIWENLGTTRIRMLDKDEAIRCLQEALRINPKSGSAQEQLKRINFFLEDTRFETRAKMKFRPGQNTGLQGLYLGQRAPDLKPELFAPGIVSVFGSNENTVAPAFCIQIGEVSCEYHPPYGVKKKHFLNDPQNYRVNVQTLSSRNDRFNPRHP